MGVWNSKIKIKDLLSDSNDQSRAAPLGKEIATRIKSLVEEHPRLLTGEVEDLILNLENVSPDIDSDVRGTPIEELNGYLNEMYDWCDAYRIWVE